MHSNYASILRVIGKMLLVKYNYILFLKCLKSKKILTIAGTYCSQSAVVGEERNLRCRQIIMIVCERSTHQSDDQ